jgi:hypothetical protein
LEGDYAVSDDITTRIDWRDIKAALAIGLVYAILLLLKLRLPGSGVGASATIVPFILTVAYIIARGRQEPGKLDTWGLTSPISGAAALIMAAFTVITAVLLATTALMLGGELDFRPGHLFRMAEYLIGAFPQQFFLCSVGLVTLATLPVLSGSWRLPLAVGICFGLAHFWTRVHFPGTLIPLQVVTTAPMGFFAAWYFLRFRNILPLTFFHAICYVLFSQWVERPLRDMPF